MWSACSGSPMRRQAVAAGGIGREPGAGRIDHGIGAQHFGALAVLITDFERRLLPPLGFRLVEAGTADRGDAAGGADRLAQRRSRRQRHQVSIAQLAAGRIGLRVRRIPSCRREQTRRGLVDIVLPRREQLDVLPLADRVAGLRSSLQHDRRHSAFEHVRRSCKADRACSDDGNRLFTHDIILLC